MEDPFEKRSEICSHFLWIGSYDYPYLGSNFAGHCSCSHNIDVGLHLKANNWSKTKTPTEILSVCLICWLCWWRLTQSWQCQDFENAWSHYPSLNEWQGKIMMGPGSVMCLLNKEKKTCSPESRTRPATLPSWEALRFHATLDYTPLFYLYFMMTGVFWLVGLVGLTGRPGWQERSRRRRRRRKRKRRRNCRGWDGWTEIKCSIRGPRGPKGSCTYYVITDRGGVSPNDYSIT